MSWAFQSQLQSPLEQNLADRTPWREWCSPAFPVCHRAACRCPVSAASSPGKSLVLTEPLPHILRVLHEYCVCCHAYTRIHKSDIINRISCLTLLVTKLKHEVRRTYKVELLLVIFSTTDLYLEDLYFSLAMSLSFDLFSFFNLSLFFGFIRGSWESLFSWSLTAFNWKYNWIRCTEVNSKIPNAIFTAK